MAALKNSKLTAVSYLLPTTESQSLAKLLRSKLIPLTIIFFVSAAIPAAAHQPVLLDSSALKRASSPLLVDGTISFAVTATFSRAGEKKYFRFALREGEALKMDYLILDRRPENALSSSRLPLVSVKSPANKNIKLRINERTKFYEPYGKTNYLFLSRISKSGESGLYEVTIRSRAKSSVLIAIGSSEVTGEIMKFANNLGTCPQTLDSELEISPNRGEQLVGLSERAGELCAEINGWGYRVIQRDGEDFAVTMDYRSNRINVKVKQEKIFEVTIG